MHLIILIWLTYWALPFSLIYLKHVQNTYISLQLGNYLAFHLKSNCFPLLTRRRRHKWTFCRHSGMHKDKTQYSKHAGITVCCRVTCSLRSGSPGLPGVVACCHFFLALWESIILHILSLDVDQNSQLEIPGMWYFSISSNICISYLPIVIYLQREKS